MAKSSLELEKEFVDGLSSETGKDLQGWLGILKKTGISKRNDIIAFLKTDKGFPHVKASLLTAIFLNNGKLVYASSESLLDAQFEKKENMKPFFNEFLKFITTNFKDTVIIPKKTYISFNVAREYAAVNIRPTELRLGLDLGTAPFDSYVEKSKLTGPMPRISHMIVLSSKSQFDAKLLSTIKKSFEKNK